MMLLVKVAKKALTEMGNLPENQTKGRRRKTALADVGSIKTDTESLEMHGSMRSVAVAVFIHVVRGEIKKIKKERVIVLHSW